MRGRLFSVGGLALFALGTVGVMTASSAHGIRRRIFQRRSRPIFMAHGAADNLVVPATQGAPFARTCFQAHHGHPLLGGLRGSRR
jgi:hypothetical protein